MNSSYTTEQDDTDEMSGYRKAQQQAAKNHKETKKESVWQPIIVAIILFTLMWWMSGCTQSEAQTKSTHVVIQEKISSNVWLFTVDGHEYLSFPDGVVHKADCKDTRIPKH